MVQIIWTPLAQEDVASVFRYYDKFSNRFAQQIVEEIFHLANGLETMPEMGALEPLLEHLGRNYRYLLIFRRYKLIYLFEHETCYMLTLWQKLDVQVPESKIILGGVEIFKD